jgi:flagellar motor switch protein FliG
MSAGAVTAIPTPVRALHGPDRVAALLLAMGKPTASRLLKRFDPLELREIARAAAALGAVSAADLEPVIEEFAGEFAAGMSLLGTAEEVERLLTGILPGEQISDIMADVLGQETANSGAGPTVWDRLGEVSEGSLADFLAKEHPQTAALILSRLGSEAAAKVIGQMSDELRNSVMRRMTSLRPVTAAGLRLLEGGMHEALISALTKSASSEAYTRMADILNRMEQTHIDSILATIAEGRPDIAKALRRMLFRFEDIAKLSAKARMTVFDQVPAEEVVLALRGTDAEFRELVLSSIASRSRRMVEHELQSADEPDPRAVKDARRSITDRIMGLITKGEVEFNPSENEPA